MAYETFQRQIVTMEDPALTVAPLPDGRISLNAAATRLFQASGVSAVKILWDRSDHGIALQAAQKRDPNSYAVVIGRGGRQATVSGRTFLRYIGWRSRHRQTVPAKWNAELKILEAKLPARFVATSGQKEAKPKTIAEL